MQFAQADNLLALVVLVPMLGAFVGYWVWKRRLMERVGDHSLLREMAAATSSRLQVARAVLALIGTALLCIAVAQPQWGQTNRPIRRTGVDLVFAMDLSQSMMAQDVAPNRLRAAKDEIETTLEVLQGDRVGLVVFTAISFVQTPLTVDYGAIRFYLDKLRTEQMPLGGTSLGRAVTDGVELLTGERVRDPDAEGIEMRRAKSQVIVLITDGEDHESDPLAAAELAKSRGIRIVTVGLGSKDGERIPVFRPSGELAGYKRDRAGNVVRTQLDEETLKLMADKTGGTYIHYSGPNSVAHELVDYINALEKSEIETLMKERYRERFGFFLAPALVFLVLSLMLGDRRRSRAKRTAAVAGVLALLLFGAGCERAFEDTLSAVDEGNEALEKGDFEEALEHYRRAEKQIPARPELHYDIGRANLGLEKWDAAAEAFARALETEDPILQFDSLFNLGLAHAGAERWREAWESFRDALVVASKVDGFDAERIAQARTNLEVAWLRLHPPCKKLEDEHEENDTADQAKTLEEPNVKDGTLCGLDDDWYVIGAMPGTRVEVTARFRELRDPPDPESVFLPKNPDLQIAVFDQTGETAIAVDQGLDEPPPAGRSATRSIARFLVDETMVSGGNPHVLLRVGAAENLEFKYDVDIVSIPPCHALEEALEDNDDPDQAKAINPGNHTMHACPGDEDWFAVDLDVGDSAFVDVRAQVDAERGVPPSFGLELFDPRGEIVATGEPEGEYLTAGVRDVTAAGRYLVHVFGTTEDEQGPYLFDVYEYAPCVVGDDRFEQNDTAGAASPLDPGQPVQRYLRACDQDSDYYRIDFAEDAKDKSVNLGIANISTPRPNTEPTERPDFEFDLVSASGDQIIAPGQPVDFPGDAEKPPIPIAKVIEHRDIEEQSAIVRVQGENEFYHLVFLDEPPPSDQNQESDEKKQNEDEQQGSESEEQKEESGEPQDQSQQDGSKGEEEEQQSPDGEEAPKSEENDEAPTPQQGDEEQEPQQPQPTEDQGDPELGRIEDLLEALEQTDDNFQMRKALENVPGRFIEKDW